MAMVSKAALIGFYILVVLIADATAMDGNGWKQLPPGAQQSYIMGVVDTWGNVAELVKALNRQPMGVEKIFIDHVACAQEKMTYAQMIAIVDKFIADNPSQWHYSMPSLISDALRAACTTRQK